MSPKQHHHPPDVLRPWVDARQDDVSVMPKARAAPNVSQKKRRRKRPVSLPQPREPCRRGVCPQVCRASHSALVKHVAPVGRGPGPRVGAVRVFISSLRWAARQCVSGTQQQDHTVSPGGGPGWGPGAGGVPSPGGSHGAGLGGGGRSPFSQAASSRTPGSSDLTLPHSKVSHTFPL